MSAANERRIRPGGLLRCCVVTIQESTEPSEPGTVLPCRYCSDRMVVAADGVWEWVRPERVS